jgi:hypothetical protein
MIINESIAKILNAEIKVLNDKSTSKDRYFFKIDSTSYFSDVLSDSIEKDLNCSYEIKYTNKDGNEHNLCHSLKMPFTIKFRKIVQSSILSITDLR